MCIRDSLIGERTAEDIKIKIGSAYPYDGEGAMDVKGRNGKNIYESPVNIYEIHAGSWKQYDDGNFYSYRCV